MPEIANTPSASSTPAPAQSKKDLRAQLKTQRKDMPADERQRADAAIADRVLALPAYAQATMVLPYLAFGSEVETRAIIERAWADGKTVALPYCVPNQRSMRWYVVESFDDLVRGPLGVLEPNPSTAQLLLGETDAVPADALALVPGLTFDIQGFRLGYGGGYYDVFLRGFAGTAVGLCREALMHDAVPFLDPHDLAVDLVVTEQRTISATAGA